MEVAENPGDLSTKYQKLATEYSKIRAQLSVVKKAVIDEQVKNRELKEEVQLKDQSIRKLEQEMESLCFRNKQMEKRVGFLQNELAQSTKDEQSRKINSPAAAASVPVDADNELLSSKIEENISLQKKISELEESHKSEIKDLKDQLEDYHFNKFEERDSLSPVFSNFGNIEITSLSTDDENNLENESKEYLIKYIKQLVCLMQLADSKAVNFYTECKSFEKLMTITSQKRHDLEFQLEVLMSRQCKLQEELQITTDNYEAQLRTMSEHLAGENEKLALQNDTIDKLKFELNAIKKRK